MMETMQYEGVLCVEFFVLNTPAGQQLIANEMAPRVHNSGHWSIEGAHTSQFTNHIRAITRQELGSTALRAPSVMINLVGEIPPGLAAQKVSTSILFRTCQAIMRAMKLTMSAFTFTESRRGQVANLDTSPPLAKMRNNVRTWP